MTLSSGVRGLSAVAILALVAYGVDPALLPGGYSAIDVLFVVAGYLAAAFISAETAERRFALGRYYGRLALWTAPALAAMLAAVSVAVRVLAPPHEVADYSLTLAASALYAANFAFARITPFFAPEAASHPLLHLWALGLAVQILALLALVCAAVMRFAPDKLRLTLMALTVLSYWSGVWGENTAPERAWYMPHMRAWELLIGALLVFGDLPRLTAPAGRAALALLGLAAICAAVVVYDAGQRQPGLPTMAPVLGAALVIYVGASGANPVSALLDARPLAALGAAAFSVYLWHWPLLAVARSIAPGLVPVVAALALTAAAAALSHRYLERPFRGAAIEWRAVAASLGGLLTLFALAVLGVAG